MTLLLCDIRHELFRGSAEWRFIDDLFKGTYQSGHGYT